MVCYNPGKLIACFAGFSLALEHLPPKETSLAKKHVSQKFSTFFDDYKTIVEPTAFDAFR